MANYPLSLSNRISYDLDGTQVFYKNGAVSYTITQLSADQLLYLNNEHTDSYVTVTGSAGQTAYLIFMFPQLRNLYGYFLTGTQNMTLQTSADTTTGIDGSWTSYGSAFSASSTAVPSYRTAQVTAGASGVKAVRLAITSFNANVHTAHFYGIPASSSFDHVEIWHPTLDQRMTLFDFEEIARSELGTKTFRVKNLSASKTANSVSVYTSVLTDTTPSVASSITYELDGDEDTTLVIGDLAAGAISDVITMNYNVPSNATVSLWCGRVVCAATSFS